MAHPNQTTTPVDTGVAQLTLVWHMWHIYITYIVLDQTTGTQTRHMFNTLDKTTNVAQVQYNTLDKSRD